MRAWWQVFDQSYDAFVCSDERLYVLCASVVCAPDGDLSDKMWEDLTIVEVYHCLFWE